MAAGFRTAVRILTDIKIGAVKHIIELVDPFVDPLGGRSSGGD